MTEARLIDGRAFAAAVGAGVRNAVAHLRRRHRVIPTLAVVLVGDDPASHVYVRAKTRQAAEARLRTEEHLLAKETPERELLDLIRRLNADDAVHGIFVQLPLPAPIRPEAVFAAVDPLKDVDGFHPLNVGRLWTGTPGLVPCTPWGCLVMLKATLKDLSGARALIVGRSAVVGKPMAALLLAENATVTVAHSQTPDLAALCREADVVVAAAGRAELIRGDWIKPGAAVIDVGINRVPAPDRGPTATRIVGDVAFEEAKRVAGWLTPVPGGVGPMTVAAVMRNTVLAACRQRGLEVPRI
ncbi:MAG TPA: bifunctional methylenetetrahydrofolate dehydrogenase/methenyltetrahydrofolate cyclohydrolase FolD [Rhodospirillales bacterium]